MQNYCCDCTKRLSSPHHLPLIPSPIFYLPPVFSCQIIHLRTYRPFVNGQTTRYTMKHSLQRKNSSILQFCDTRRRLNCQSKRELQLYSKFDCLRGGEWRRKEKQNGLKKRSVYAHHSFWHANSHAASHSVNLNDSSVLNLGTFR